MWWCLKKQKSAHLPFSEQCLSEVSVQHSKCPIGDPEGEKGPGFDPVLTQYPVLREGAVADGVGRLVFGDVVHGDADALVHVLVVENVVSVTAEQRQHTLPVTSQSYYSLFSRSLPFSRSHAKSFSSDLH